MTALVQVWFADLLVNGMAGLAVCLILFLLRLEFREKGQQRREQRERRRQRLAHWGHE